MKFCALRTANYSHCIVMIFNHRFLPKNLGPYHRPKENEFQGLISKYTIRKASLFDYEL